MANTSGPNRTTAWFIVGFIVLVTAGVIIAGAYSSGSPSTSSATPGNPNFVATTAPAITSADWTTGDPHATVSFIEYGDYECPACGEYAPIVKQLIQNYGSKVLFVFRNFPLTTIHPNAQISAQAAEAAGLQGKFWEMHDLLYQDQANWVSASPNQVVSQYFDGYAKSLGLDVNKFNQDIGSAQVLDKIQADVAGGNAAAIDHTPTYFINLKQIPNPGSYSQFQTLLDQALASASGTPVSATVTSSSAPVTVSVTSTPAK